MANFGQSNHALHMSHCTLFIPSKLWLKVWRMTLSAGAGTTGEVTQGHGPTTPTCNMSIEKHLKTNEMAFLFYSDNSLLLSLLYSLGIIYGVFSFSNLVAPTVVTVIGPKFTMFISGLLYR